MSNTQDIPAALCDATIFTGDSMEENRALLMKGGKIVDIVAPGRLSPDTQRISCASYILAPGFIDVQVNGGGNVLFNNTPTAEACIAITQAHRAFGTTRLLPTCVSDKPEVTAKAVAAMREARQSNTSILGVHIEGPHLGAERRGVHKAEFLRGMDENDLHLYQPKNGEIMLITVAPESVSAEQIRTLHKQGVLVSLGHTGAMPEQIHAALDAGATGFTHLFNGMGSLSARTPGPAGVALDDRASWCSIIADGHHVSPEMIRIAFHAKPKGKLFLVSDAMPPVASNSPKPFQLYGETIHVENGRCINGEGKLAGAAITLADAVQYCVTKAGIEIDEALRMASAYPAAFLGLENKFGKLLPGYAADIVALDAELKPAKVWVDGTT